ncbi:acetyl-CoA carboxylase biotin carboxyl carrier protein subunit [soil metagenome]
MLYHVTIGGRTFRVELDGEIVRVDGEEIATAQLAAFPGTAVRHLLTDGRSTTVVAHRDDDGWSLVVNGWPMHAHVVDERTRAIQAMTGQGAVAQGPKPVRAPMPGLVVRIEVDVGDDVKQGQGVVVMEAMKMENELRAESAGRVGRVLVQPGDVVQKGAVLVEFEAAHE